MSTTTLPPITSTLADDPDMLELVEMFVTDIPEKISAFETQLAEGNWAKLKQISHQLKGSAGGYGFDCVTPFARKIEQATQSDQPDVDALRIHIQQLIEVLRRLSV